MKAQPILWVAVIAAVGMTGSAAVGAERAADSKKERPAAILVFNQEGRAVPSGLPSATSQTFDVSVGPGAQRIFSPSTVNISVGDTVKWTWASNNHTVTSGANCSADSQFCAPSDMNCPSEMVFGTGTVYQHTFTTAGSYTYYCAIHCGSGMIGTVNVTSPLQLTSAVSRKTHGSAGAFDIPLPLSGEPGVECRSSAGNHTFVFSFSNDVMAGSASVTAGTGTISGSPSFAANTMTVNLTGVSDAQQVTVTLSGVTDTSSHVLPDTAVSVNTLVGDTTGNKTVNASDVSQTKAQSGQAVTATNFRQDVNINGSINASDVSLVKSRSGMSVP